MVYMLRIRHRIVFNVKHWIIWHTVDQKTKNSIRVQLEAEWVG